MHVSTLQALPMYRRPCRQGHGGSSEKSLTTEKEQRLLTFFILFIKEKSLEFYLLRTTSDLLCGENEL